MRHQFILSPNVPADYRISRDTCQKNEEISNFDDLLKDCFYEWFYKEEKNNLAIDFLNEAYIIRYVS